MGTYSTPASLRTNLGDLACASGKLFLIDYEFCGEAENGISLAQDLKISSQAVLITSRAEEPLVVDACLQIGLKLLPKFAAGTVPLGPWQLPRDGQLDAVLLDDDGMVHRMWTMRARRAGKRVAMFKTPGDFFRAADSWRLDLPIYIDAELGCDLRSEEVIVTMQQRGFTNAGTIPRFAPGHLLPVQMP